MTQIQVANTPARGRRAADDTTAELARVAQQIPAGFHRTIGAGCAARTVIPACRSQLAASPMSTLAAPRARCASGRVNRFGGLSEYRVVSGVWSSLPRSRLVRRAAGRIVGGVVSWGFVWETWLTVAGRGYRGVYVFSEGHRPGVPVGFERRSGCEGGWRAVTKSERMFVAIPS